MFGSWLVSHLELSHCSYECASSVSVVVDCVDLASHMTTGLEGGGVHGASLERRSPV